MRLTQMCVKKKCHRDSLFNNIFFYGQQSIFYRRNQIPTSMEFDTQSIRFQNKWKNVRQIEYQIN